MSDTMLDAVHTKMDKNRRNTCPCVAHGLLGDLIANDTVLVHSVLLEPNSTDWMVYNEEEFIGSQF